MKKLVLTLAIIGFVSFSALSIQNLVASSHQTVIMTTDKDPKKADTKKADDTKEVKADAKKTETGTQSCGTTCTDKQSTSKSCCSGEHSSCCGSKSETPDKK
jgi:hypothetical protein